MSDSPSAPIPAMKKYRKRPVVIEAIRWTGGNIEEALAFMAPIEALPSDGLNIQPGVGYVPAMGTLDIPTLEGTMIAQPGDWIIKGVKGEFYPCKPDIFEANYEVVNSRSDEDDSHDAELFR